MVNSPEQAIAHCAAQSAHGPRFGVGYCKQEVRIAYGIPESHSSSAAEAWAEAKLKHSTDDLAGIPRGALLFWLGGTHGYGHVAICAGNGKMWSTDIERPGYFDLADIDTVRKRWGLSFVGWAQDMDGVRVFTPPAQAHPAVYAAVHAAPGPERRLAMKHLAEHGNPTAARAAQRWLNATAIKSKALGELTAMVTP